MPRRRRNAAQRAEYDANSPRRRKRGVKPSRSRHTNKVNFGIRDVFCGAGAPPAVLALRAIQKPPARCRRPLPPLHRANGRNLSTWMGRLQPIVTKSRRPPRFPRELPKSSVQSMMPGAVKDVGHSHGSRRGSHLDCGKQRMITHNELVRKAFIDAAVAKIECRSIVQARPAPTAANNTSFSRSQNL